MKVSVKDELTLSIGVAVGSTIVRSRLDLLPLIFSDNTALYLANGPARHPVRYIFNTTKHFLLNALILSGSPLSLPGLPTNRCLC